MRFAGRDWHNLTRAAVLACLGLFVFAASASAARYAVPSGGLASGSCDAANACTLKYAIESAVSGETVNVDPGNYSVSAAISGGDVVVVGAGPNATTITGAAGLAGPVLTLNTGASIANLTVESQDANVALDLTGTGDSIEVYGSAGNAMIIRGGSDLNNSVVHTPAASAAALRVNGGIASATNIRHSTIVATGSGSTGLDASGILASPNVSSSIANGIANDITGDLVNPVAVSYSAWRTLKSSNYSAGAGNRNATAVFFDAPARNFQQDETSQSVDTGNNSDAVSFDIDGRPRTIAAGTDMGAYELPVPPTAATGAATPNADGVSAHIDGTVNPRGTATTYVARYGTTSPPGTASGSTSAGSVLTDVAAGVDLTGLLPGTRYYYRISATNTWGTTDGSISTFDTPTIAPVATDNTPSPVSATSARLRGSVNPGGESTSAKFEWGETAAYGNSTAVQTLTGSTDTSLASVTISGLKPGTEYHYRVWSQNTKGTSTTTDATFTTPTRAPITGLAAISGVSTTGATVNGTVDPGGASTDWSVEYGVGSPSNTALGGTVTGSTVQNVTKGLTGLLPGTTYSYRLAATNADGTDRSLGSFTTQVAVPTASIGAAGSVTSRGARVNGTLNPGGDSATYGFEYSKDNSFGESTGTHPVPDGTDDVAVARNLNGLEPGTVYNYRLVVTNSAGTATTSAGTFTTAVAQPGVATDRAQSLGQTSASLSGAVNPGGGSTTWYFEYGRTTAYGHSTAAASLTAGNVDETVAATIENLEPGTTYHFRLVARNAAGETLGEDATFTTATADAPGTGDGDDIEDPVDPVPAGDGPVQADGLPVATPQPPAGRAANAAPASGTVRVQLPGSEDFVTLTEGASIPVGTVVDATEGEVTITSAADSRGTPQTANFGGSEFKVLQKRAAKPVTDIVMTGGDFTGCFPRALNKQSADVFAAARRKWSRRRLWGNGHGRFRTRGRNGTATVRGTHWLTEDRCDGTLVRVKRGLVEVRDLERRRTVMVGAGEQYFARSLEVKKLPRKKR